jgi:hypothetical protein
VLIDVQLEMKAIVTDIKDQPINWAARIAEVYDHDHGSGKAAFEPGEILDVAADGRAGMAPCNVKEGASRRKAVVGPP